MRWGLFVLCCSACGRIGFAPQGDAADAADAAPDAPFPTGPFGPPTPVPELSSTLSDDDVSLTGDMLEIYFNSYRSGPLGVWSSTRVSVDDPWSPPVEHSVLGTANNPRISLDGLTLYCSNTNDIYYTTRADRGAPWSALQLLPLVDMTANDYEPWLDADELVIYFSVLPATGPDGIARAERASTSEPFGPATLVASIQTVSYDGSTWVREDEQLLVYHSDISGNRDLYMSARASTAEAWSTPVALSELNTVSTDADPWLSPDGHTVYFVSGRNGNDDIFMATR